MAHDAGPSGVTGGSDVTEMDAPSEQSMSQSDQVGGSQEGTDEELDEDDMEEEPAQNSQAVETDSED